MNVLTAGIAGGIVILVAALIIWLSSRNREDWRRVDRKPVDDSRSSVAQFNAIMWRRQ